MSTEDITIWRFNLHTHHSTEEQIKTFEYCESNKIIGTGWRTEIRLMDSEKEHISNDEFYKRLDNVIFSNQRGFKNSMKSLKEINFITSCKLIAIKTMILSIFGLCCIPF